MIPLARDYTLTQNSADVMEAIIAFNYEKSGTIINSKKH
ncbi:MAG: hypothetical protein ACJA2C_001995 [Marinoscillum sp.]|jgi:hypothetical protein